MLCKSDKPSISISIIKLRFSHSGFKSHVLSGSVEPLPGRSSGVCTEHDDPNILRGLSHTCRTKDAHTWILSHT